MAASAARAAPLARAARARRRPPPCCVRSRRAGRRARPCAAAEGSSAPLSSPEALRARFDASSAALPVREVLPDVVAALGRAANAVLEAPPGAGKTTALPLALLLDAQWLVEKEKIVVLEPRRLAARAAASRMASSTCAPPTRSDVLAEPGTRLRVEAPFVAFWCDVCALVANRLCRRSETQTQGHVPGSQDDQIGLRFSACVSTRRRGYPQPCSC